MIIFSVTMLIASVFIFDWLFFVMGVGGRVMTWIPEFISIFIALSIPFMTAGTKSIHLPLKYTLLLILYLLHIIIGFILNDVAGWTMLAGFRMYAKFIPVFLIPVIYPFNDRAFKKLIIWIYILSMLQLPVVLWQRFIKYASSLSGDPMGGTLGMSSSGILAIYLIIITSFLIAFYFKDQISLPVFLLSTVAAVIPITLNETKISFVLLPIAFIFPAFFIKAKRESIFRLILVIITLILSFLILNGIYNHFAKKRWGYGIEGFVTKQGLLEKYSQSRVKPMEYALTRAINNPLFFFFGHGAGNVSKGFTNKLDGKYMKEGLYYGIGTTFTKLMWETGVLGTILFFMFPFFIFIDSIKLCKQDGLPGAFALGMITCTVIFSLSTFYTFTIDSNVLIFMFFLASGQIASMYDRYVKKYPGYKLSPIVRPN